MCRFEKLIWWIQFCWSEDESDLGRYVSSRVNTPFVWNIFTCQCPVTSDCLLELSASETTMRLRGIETVYCTGDCEGSVIISSGSEPSESMATGKVLLMPPHHIVVSMSPRFSTNASVEHVIHLTLRVGTRGAHKDTSCSEPSMYFIFISMLSILRDLCTQPMCKTTPGIHGARLLPDGHPWRTTTIDILSQSSSIHEMASFRRGATAEPPDQALPRRIRKPKSRKMRRINASFTSYVCETE